MGRFYAVVLVPTPELAIKHRMQEQTSAVCAAVVAPEIQEPLLRALIERMARHDEPALAQFYDATVARVYALARRITRESTAAEEVVADVYWQAWQQAGRYDAARGRALAWLLMMCRARALDHLRRREPAQAHAAPDSLRPDLYRDDNDPLALSAALESSTRVHAALAALHDDARRLLALAFFQGMSHQEIADHTGMPLGTVKTVLRRAMQELKQTFENASIALEEPS